MPINEMIAYGIVLALVLVIGLLIRRRLSSLSAPRYDPSKHIVVDGSNVMHWGGDPSAMVLIRVLEALAEKGLTPIVFFDANVGYKLWDSYHSAGAIAPKIGIDARRVIIAPKGVTADELLLEAAVEIGLRVVTNDRFLDWRQRYPQAAEKGFLIKGTWQQGTVIFRGL